MYTVETSAMKTKANTASHCVEVTISLMVVVIGEVGKCIEVSTASCKLILNQVHA